ncbi:16S rRNA (adenine(1518)-N(6)/adenine(1519)-N(6))-dimethyltransferase RsmA [Helcococcus kunzii]|uniref:Ribosomal RNA small subunit methyltransferase A n=2 Tax=Helcococcus kunzii TaxID=40091 RepID=H3NL96_9FIRM|nr:16S rRNA (adenine(1518)-N(6)/adenine(1519)-N(6))-dimethyltransferase RsmA [Helcococcus kunzii]EHR36077.1 dimethyladenosine transferase [Helcococcus kunzii ATCC 51366]MCT1796651.1 16S rRNA (adenine(1518)-N(6)/adenine(1519)-N(6))-dimethyltransferase RsmA [Helcococcus kunzii]MCT1988705.1 16S rRNA (adenine(1518)-N(6)/adenine(1519)-N(6))-dimethyltransferase RsmA [Helcococcus kunzii]QUY64111.1 16S rRNA (adenine(1518)-N(6)/adenine(1519)-N(6))-dimethyltransferase RsmA [Helcococcus kunzii]
MERDRLYSPKVVKELKKFFDFNFSKGLGQNFLIDGKVVRAISEGAKISAEDNVLEIGPGFGTLTEELLLKAKKVVAVELDERLNVVLSQTVGHFDNFVLVNADILKADLKQLVSDQFGDEPFKVVANLPYYITTPIIELFLESELNVKSLTFMVQKEVGDRILANPGNKIYGSLTVFVNFYSVPSLVVKAPKEIFMPRPKVDSVVINLEMKEKLPDVDKIKFFKLMRGGFTKRRKNLLNSLTTDVSLGITKEKLSQILEELEIPSNYRAEDLSLEDFINITNLIDKYV